MNDMSLLEDMVTKTANEPEPVRRTVAQNILRQMLDAFNAEDFPRCAALGILGKRCRAPLENLDFLRALTFLRQGDAGSAREALKEELRWFPNNAQAQEMLAKLMDAMPAFRLPKDIPSEFTALYKEIAPYTMVEPPRLFSLYTHAMQVCAEGPEGCFVECGVAGGGTSGLLSSVIKRNKGGQTLFCCDSFSGMPPAGNHDRHGNMNAEASGWGAGTCSAPESSLTNLCEQLHTRDVIRIVKGYFEETLPVVRQEMGPIAFLHMDGDWYSSTKAILENLYDQLVPRAYVQIDDYGYWDGCRKAVDEFFAARRVTVALTYADSSGVFFFKP